MENQKIKQKQKLYRNIAMTFRVTPGERDEIRSRQKETGIKNQRSYLLKMALNGRIINIELDSITAMNRALSGISNNVNQIARRVNQTGILYQVDIEGITTYLDEIWKSQSEILCRLLALLEVFDAKTPERRKKNRSVYIPKFLSTTESGAADGAAGLTGFGVEHQQVV